MTAARAHAIGEPGFTSELLCEPESVRRARQFVSSSLSTWGLEDELGEIAALVVSELLTNAISHTRCRTAQVVIERRQADLVRICVEDDDPGRPDTDLRRPSDEAVGGRGLLLVDALSHRWGYDRRPHGKVAWAELRASACG
ncbi:ATP-binding protein [Streptomyces antibioticus]|uniref:ATP-binding protein n=1 Tax=Streptomyces antibioticus TaxID=1890 RepID=UPI0033A914ED